MFVKENIRLRALRYINELNHDKQSDFRPYVAERGELGRLLSFNQKHLSQPTIKMKCKQVDVMHKGSENKSKSKMKSQLDLSSIYQLDQISPKSQLKAQEYKLKHEKQALIALLVKQKAPTDDKFRWRMNSIDKGKKLTYLFYEPKLRWSKSRASQFIAEQFENNLPVISPVTKSKNRSESQFLEQC